MKYQLINNLDFTLSPIEQVLANRGILKENFTRTMYPDETDYIDPLKLINMKQGASMLIRHISQNNGIFIQVD